MKCEILSVGTEILLGDILNTNSKYLSEKMAELGISVFKHTTVGDNEMRLSTAIKNALNDNDLLLITGGLGPTRDDITKETCAKVLGLPLIINEESYNRLKEYFDNNDNAIENNVKQAKFPKDATILPNHNGTADGCIIESDNKTIVILPGPPFEMEPMYEKYVHLHLSKYSDVKYFSRFYRITGMGEWQMSKTIDDLIESQSNPTIAPYAKKEALVIKLTAAAVDEAEAQLLFKPYEDEFKERFKDNYLGYDDRSLEVRIGELLLEKNLTISCAESITGGMIASTLINYPGISNVLKESFIVYSDSAKSDILGVDAEVLNQHTAVSEEVLLEMLEGLKNKSGTDICIATTGYAGPGGDKVGLCYYGYKYKDVIYTNGRTFKGPRNEIRHRVTREVLSNLLKDLLK